MKKNVGKIDRIVRFLLGAVFAVLAFYWKCWFSAIIAVLLFFSAAAGWCGMYKVFGVTTCKLK